MKKLSLLFLLMHPIMNALFAQQYPFQNAALPIDTRVSNLLQQLTLKEKISLIGYRSQSVDRLNIPAYNWWNEALHGVARAGKATVFPQAIGMSASFNTPLMHEVASVISTEARAKNNLAVQQNRRLQYMGITFWSPNINIFRDPRWGRGQETYGEDPFLTAQMGVAFIKGLQGNDKRYLKTSATAKHFAVHSGPEAQRHTFNAIVDEKDLRETYLYAFKKLVDAGVESVMCGYNRLNDEPCCTSNTLLQKILKNEWQFKGHIVTDCWALEDIWLRHKVSPNSVTVAAEAIKAGINLDCSNLLQDDALKAVEQKLLTEKDIDHALAGILRTQFKLGFYDSKMVHPFAQYGADSVANTYHTSLARKMAAQSMVLLKNNNNILPLNPSKYGSLMVLGPTAASLDALLGNYHGVSGKAVNFVEGITEAVGPGVRVEYDQGCDFIDTVHFGGLWAAGNADITIAVLGLTPVYEGEEGDAFLAAGGGDKISISLPASQIAFMKALRKAHTKPIIAVITAGSAVDVSAIEPYCDAIIYAWYPGEQGGHALADIVFGKVSPSGKLPVTFYQSLNDLPAYADYGLKGRTYRYFEGQVQYPFGFGLSYTNFKYGWNKQPILTGSKKDTLSFSVEIANTGLYDADDVVQVYIQYPAVQRMPLKELKAFQKVSVKKNGQQVLRFNIPLSELQKWDLEAKGWTLYNGQYTIVVGKHSRDEVLTYTIDLNGSVANSSGSSIQNTSNHNAAFTKSLAMNGIQYKVTASGEGSLQSLVIVTSGLSKGTDTVHIDIDPVVNAEIADLDKDGFPELLVYTQSAGSGSYGSVIGFSPNKGQSLSSINFPEFAEGSKEAKGYMGHDVFKINASNLTRRFPIYTSTNANAKPSGKFRELTYQLKKGEAGKQFILVGQKE